MRVAQLWDLLWDYMDEWLTKETIIKCLYKIPSTVYENSTYLKYNIQRTGTKRKKNMITKTKKRERGNTDINHSQQNQTLNRH